MSAVILIVALLWLGSRGLHGALVWDRGACATDPDQFMPEGPAENIGRFPWLGVVQHSFLIGGKTRFAVTTGLLIHPSYAIAPAEDIAKIRPEALVNNTKFVVWFNASIKYSLDVKDYSLHPEYSEGVTIASLALLEIDTLYVVGVPDVKTPILPICLNLEGAATMTDLYAVKITDVKGELFKEVYKMDFVDDKDCEEFYHRAKLSYRKMKPSRFLCAVSETQTEPCVWEGGVALVTRLSWGHWKLIGFGVRGPGCGAPARFIFVASYLEWIEEVISLIDMLEEELDEKTHKIYFRRQSPIKIEMFKGKTKVPKQHGQCDRNVRGGVMFKDSSELLVNKNFGQGFYFVSVAQIAQFSCAVVELVSTSRTNSAVWVEHSCHREMTGLAPNMKSGPDRRKLECFMYFNSKAFIEFRFYFSFKAKIELTLYGRADIPRFVANPFLSKETTEIWKPTAELLRYGSFAPYYLSWYEL